MFVTGISKGVVTYNIDCRTVKEMKILVTSQKQYIILAVLVYKYMKILPDIYIDRYIDIDRQTDSYTESRKQKNLLYICI